MNFVTDDMFLFAKSVERAARAAGHNIKFAADADRFTVTMRTRAACCPLEARGLCLQRYNAARVRGCPRAEVARHLRGGGGDRRSDRVLHILPRLRHRPDR